MSTRLNFEHVILNISLTTNDFVDLIWDVEVEWNGINRDITVSWDSRHVETSFGRWSCSDRSVRRTHAWRDRAALGPPSVPADKTVDHPSRGQWSTTTERYTSPIRICNNRHKHYKSTSQRFFLPISHLHHLSLTQISVVILLSSSGKKN